MEINVIPQLLTYYKWFENVYSNSSIIKDKWVDLTQFFLGVRNCHLPEEAFTKENVGKTIFFL